MHMKKETVIAWIWWIVVGSMSAGLVAVFTLPALDDDNSTYAPNQAKSEIQGGNHKQSVQGINVGTVAPSKKEITKYDDTNFRAALAQIPTVESWTIDNGTLIVFLYPRHQTNAHRIARVLCIARTAHNAKNVELVRIMDSIKFRRSNEYAVLLRRLC